MAEILKQKNIHVGSGAMSATFVKSSKSENDPDAHLRYAHGIVSEYLMDDLSQKLLKYLNLSEDPQFNLKRKSLTQAQNDAKKTKTEEENKSSTSNVLDLSKPEPKPAKPPSISSKDKSRAKAATGSKTISSFFKKS